MRWTVYGVFSVSHVITGIGYRYVEDMHPDLVAAHIVLFDILVISRTAVKLALDGFMVYQFIVVFRYLVERKKEQSDYTTFNILVTYLTALELGLFITRQLI